MTGFASLTLAHSGHAGVGVEIRNVHAGQFGIPAAGQQRAAHKIAECWFASVDQPHALGLGEIAHTRRVDRFERLNPPPCIVARDMPGLPGVV